MKNEIISDSQAFTEALVLVIVARSKVTSWRALQRANGLRRLLSVEEIKQATKRVPILVERWRSNQHSQ